MLREAPRIELILLFLEIGRARLLLQLFEDLQAHGQHWIVPVNLYYLPRLRRLKPLATCQKVLFRLLLDGLFGGSQQSPSSITGCQDLR